MDIEMNVLPGELYAVINPTQIFSCVPAVSVKVVKSKKLKTPGVAVATPERASYKIYSRRVNFDLKMYGVEEKVQKRSAAEV
jgi:hypothetical protein